MDKENILDEIQKEKKEISGFLDEFLEDWEKVEDSSRWRSDLKNRMQKMVKGGKMVRGSLVMKTSKFYKGENKKEAVKVAGAIELLHTGLLMHDDIIDRDETRRGLPTFSKQYRDLGEEEKIDDTHHFGTGMGITAGDIAFFIGQGILAEIEENPEIRRKITKLVFSEFSAVGLAEQADIHAGHSRKETSEEEIRRLYRDKTARYTFSLPMKAGAILAGVKDKEIEKLYSLGEKIGLVFQLRDDELGLFGDKDKTGKEVGSDLDENKKTLLRLKLLEKLPEDETEEMQERLHGELSREDREEITSMIEELGVRKDVRTEMKEIAGEARKEVEELEAPGEFKDFLKELIEFCLHRRK